MDPQFWHERWQLNEIGFHQNQAHAWLMDFWPGLNLQSGTVLVPLCGKSLDMVWLRQQGHQVLGVELSPLAVSSFFEEQGLAYTVQTVDGFQAYRAEGIDILCGDFFALTASHLENVSAVYDRAALVALPEAMQARYAETLLRLLPQRPPILLVTFAYDPAEMQGPPFSVPRGRVEQLFGSCYAIEELAKVDALALQPGLRARGLTGLHESLYYLRAA